ncbi:hypothetical protein Tco_1352765 [Tanacetum coccineum]
MSFSRFFFLVTLIASSSSKSSSTKGDVLEVGGVLSNVTLSDSLTFLVFSGRAVDLEEIQDEDTSPSKITSEIPIEVEGFEPPQEEVIPVRRFERTHRAPDHLCLNVEADEHSIGNLNEPTSYKAAMLDSESNKWIDAMNAEI